MTGAAGAPPSLDEQAASWAAEVVLERLIEAALAGTDRADRLAALCQDAFVEGGVRTYGLAQAGRVPLLIPAEAHDARVAELLAANNREVDRRRDVEKEAGRLRALLWKFADDAFRAQQLGASIIDNTADA